MHGENVAVVDWQSAIAVFAALLTSLTASWYAWRFSKTVGGDMGAAFKWVMVGVLIFAVTRADDALKVTGMFDRMGLDYKKVMWLPHSLAVLVAWALITVGFYRMNKAFSV
jgi:hypothetical protein